MLLVPRSTILVSGAGAPLEVEAQRQRVEVAEHVLGQAPRRVLPDPLEDGVAQIVEQHAAEARAGISDDQRDGEPDRRLHARRHRSIAAL